MTNQDNHLPKFSDYKDCIVAFVDILGFDSKVREIKSEAEFSHLSLLLYAIKTTAENFNKNTEIFKTLNFTAISDSIILSMPYKDPVCAMALITILHQTQYEILYCYNTILRGYITRGTVYHKDGIIFGKGYSDAYMKEKDIGHAPRIVIDPKLIEDAWQKLSNYKSESKVDHIFNYLVEDTNDGYFYINYFKPNGILKNISKENLILERTNIQSFIENMLIEHKNNEKIFRKYKWLNNYLSRTQKSFEKIINA